MYAVIRTGGKQYRVSAGDVIEVERLPGEAGGSITFDQVLMVGGEGGEAVGAPHVSGASVTATVLEQMRAPKVFIFKKRRRKGYRRRKGHRQELTVLRVTGIAQGNA